MQSNTKQQQLTFENGITNSPSDAICDDNCLSEESMGMIYRDGEHHVVQYPRISFNLNQGERLLFIHKVDSDSRKIYLRGNDVYSDTHGLIMTSAGDAEVTAIARLLVIRDDNGLHYYAWKDYGYGSALEDIPDPHVEFSFRNANERWIFSGNVETGNLWMVDDDVNRYEIHGTEGFHNAIDAAHKDAIAKSNDASKFYGSFCVRFGLKLRDGSYYKVSQPIFMLNMLDCDAFVEIRTRNDIANVRLMWPSGYLYYKFSQNYTPWESVVKSVVVFITRQYDHFPEDLIDSGILDNINHSASAKYINQNKIITETIPLTWGVWKVNENRKSDANVTEVIRAGNYYELCELGLTGNGDFTNIADRFNNEHRLAYLESLNKLDVDDFYSRSKLYPKDMFVYNSRLIIANISRSYFEGFDDFMPLDWDSDYNYFFFVTLQTDDGTVVVKHEKTTKQKQGIYFYYPDRRATHVVIYRSSGELVVGQATCILNADLTEHPHLNGAYYFNFATDEPTTSWATPPTESDRRGESLSNYIMSSEVFNPYTFPATGYSRVSAGTVLAITTITQALSQGQFGQYPLLAFTDTGIYALSMNSEGVFTAVHPMSREVCNNVKSITQTDDSIFFSSDKGLMQLQGGSVVCVSQQLSGKDTNGTFVDFLKEAIIAYDYRDSLLWITRDDEGYSYIYSLKSGTFTKIAHKHTLPQPSAIVDFAGIVSNGAEYEWRIEPDEMIYEDYTTQEISQLDPAPRSVTTRKVYYQEGHIFLWQTFIVDNLGASYSVFSRNFDSESAPATTTGVAYRNITNNLCYRYYDGNLLTEDEYRSSVDGSELLPPEHFHSIVNNYPDTLLQSENRVYSLLNRDNVNDDDTAYSATLISRPMKLENGLALKSVMQVRHVCDISRLLGATMSFRIYASNNMRDWVELHALRGTPWKYFKFKYEFSNLRAADTFAGTVIVTQERRSGKLR